MDDELQIWDEIRELGDDIEEGRAEYDTLFALHTDAYRLSDGTEVVLHRGTLLSVDTTRTQHVPLYDLDTSSERWYACLGHAYELLTLDARSRAVVEGAPFRVTVPDVASWLRAEYEDLDYIRSLDLRALAHLGVMLEGWSWPESLLRVMSPALLGADGTREVSWSGLPGDIGSYQCFISESTPLLLDPSGRYLSLDSVGAL